MRNIILLLTILLAQHGQEHRKIVDTKVTSKGVRYDVIGLVSSSITKRWCANTANKLDKENIIVPEAARFAFTSIDMGASESKRRDLLIRDAFISQGRTIPNDTIMVHYILSIKGKVLETRFVVSSVTKMSIEDIAIIEETLKDKYVVKMDAEKFADMKYTWYAAPIFLSRIKNL